MKFLDSGGVTTLWERIKGKFLSLDGGTMNDDAAITIYGSNGYVRLQGGDTHFGWPTYGTLTQRAIVFHNHQIGALGIKIYDSYNSNQPSLAISNQFIGFTESDSDFNISTTATYSTKITPTSISTSDVTASGIVAINGTTTTIADSGSISISSTNGGVTISSDSNDINLSANGVVNTSDLSVSGGIDCTSTISCKNVTLDALTAAQLKAIATALFEFNSGSYHSAKLIGWDATNKVATITFNINCGNPVTALKVSYDGNAVGVILPRYTSPYIGAITLAVPLDGSYAYDGQFMYEVDAI